MMNLCKNAFILIFLIGSTAAASAQKSIREYAEKTGREKLMKKVVMPVGSFPQTAGGYDDGHGSTPLLTSVEQLPDTVALVTFHIYDLGTANTVKDVSITYYSLTEKGGNLMATSMLRGSIAQLKESFKKVGVVLLTPDEYLNTPAKKKYYYNTFQPRLSKMGKMLSGIETAQQDISVAAEGYRAFDISAANDFLRAESLGGDLAMNLGVNAVLSIAIELVSDNRRIMMNGVKMAMHGPNPLPKADKKYIAQNLGAGYYSGQIYASGYSFFDNSIEVGRFEKKKQSINENFDGLDLVFDSFVTKFDEKMRESVAKAAKKYSK